jgi:hypothetical protein
MANYCQIGQKMNQWSDTQKKWKAFPLRWELYAEYNNETEEIKRLTPFQIGILLAAVKPYRWQTRWIDLGISEEQLEREIAEIEDRLMKEEDGFGMATQEDIAKGMYQAFNWLALQVATGQYANIALSTDEDGVVSLPSGSDTPVELPEDDITTPYDDSLAAQMGGTIEVSRALEFLYDKIDTLYGNVNGTPTTSATDAKVLIKSFFDCDGALMDLAIDQYYTYRTTNGKLFFDVSSAMQLYMFCRSGGERAWSQWLSDQSGYPVIKISAMNALSTALNDGFWNGYFADGATKPSTQFLDASCVKIAPQTLTNLVFAVARTTTPLKSQHRMLFKVKGYALDVDGDIQDFFWYRTAAGVNTFTTPTFVHSAGSNLPSQNQVVYNASHVYEYTIDLQALNAIMTITMNKHANMNAAGLTYPVPFEIELIDLGEYAI